MRSLCLPVALWGAMMPACSLEDALGVSESDTSTTGTSDPTGGSAETTASVDDGTTEGTDTVDPTTGGGSTDTSPPAGCAGRTLRVATYNTQSVEPPGSPGFQALAQVVARIDADVVCLQEVLFYEDDNLAALAEQTGYTRVIQANEPPAIGGDFTNACLSREPMIIEGSYGGWELSGDPDANDVGRDILVVRVDLSGGGEPCGVGVVTLHLKSGQDPLDWFRRQVEAVRVTQAVERYRDAHPGEPMLIMGDLNETIDDVALGSVFDQIPAGLPPSYEVGDDIAVPLTYQPFDTFEALEFAVVDAAQEDSPFADATWADIVRLDYVLHAGLTVDGSEVYNSCLDNGVDDDPPGNWLPKAGDPLPCGVSEAASDHFPVFVDLTVP